MAKNDFDSDFDLEKELGFDPKEFLGETDDEEIDLSEFDENGLDFDLSGTETGEDSADDFDISEIDLGEDYAPASGEEYYEEGEYAGYDPETYAAEEYAGDPYGGYSQETDAFLEDEELHGSYETAGQPQSYEDRGEAAYDASAYDEAAYDEASYDEAAYEEAAYDENAYQEEPAAYEEGEYEEGDYDEAGYEPQTEDYDEDLDPEIDYGEDDEDLDPDADPDADPEPAKAPRKPRKPLLAGFLKKKEKKEKKEPREPGARPHREHAQAAGQAEQGEHGAEARKERRPRKQKPAGPSFFSKVMDLYFAPVLAEASRDPNSYEVDPRNPRRRRPSKKRIFKEVYLPPLILCLALILVLTCVVGSVTHAIQRKQIRDEEAVRESIAQQSVADQAAQELKYIMEQSQIMAMGYDYEGAIKLIESYSDFANAPQDMLTRKAEYIQAQNMMREWKDPALIPNLSFHVLIADPARAFADKEYGGQYNRNFVTVDEFQKILESLYKSNYVLVDFDSFVDRNTGVDGKESFFVKPILLPEGKQPVMITETMVNYFNYMIDIDADGPDGFASRLVVDGNGDIKAELVDAQGQVQVGNYDLVPILEAFIAEHPDFSYRGARATLAVTGDEGIFGYRINTSAISDPNLGAAYHEKEVAGAKVLVQALRDKGYTLASYTYANTNYAQLSVKQINKELQDWKSQVTPVMGEVDTIVFAKESDINDYTGNKFQALYDQGMRYFVGQADKPTAEVNQTYVHQKRLMVSGNAIQWHPDRFKGMFDCAAIKNPTRGDVPN